jgi:hypothetical protein
MSLSRKYLHDSLIFVPCLLDLVEMTNKCTDCTTPVFHILAPTCFGSSLPSLGSLLDPSELLQIQIEWVVYHIMCGYVVCVHSTQLGSTTDGTTTFRHTDHVTTHCMRYHHFDLYFT